MARRVALLTGSTGQLGPAIARALAADGWSLVLQHRHSAARARALAEELGARVEAADLGDPEEARALAARATEAFGHVDALVHAAGGFADEDLMSARPEAWRHDLAVHAESFHALVTSLAPSMRARKSGRIVAFGMAGMERFPAFTRTTGHAIAKAAVLVLARAFAKELFGDGISVNVVAPGRVREDGADDVADVVRFLLSPEGRAVNGAIVPVAGTIGLSPL